MISIRGARENNLVEVDLDLPLGQLVVFCGLSGSGKSSLAFDTLHQEGQRRYLEALLLGRGGLQRPDVVSIEGLPPTIGLDQRERSPAANETVAGLAELAVPLSVLFARAGVQHCPTCGTVIEPLTPASIAERLLQLPDGTRLTLEGPLDVQDEAVLEEVERAGFSRVRAGGTVQRLSEVQGWTGPLTVVVDRIKTSEEKRDRIIEAVRLAAQVGRGVLHAVHEQTEVFVDRPVCPKDGTRVPEPSPTRFRMRTDPLDPGAAAVQLAGATFDALRDVTPQQLLDRLAGLPSSPVVDTLRDEITDRVGTLKALGLGHLAIGRSAVEVSRGEALRLRLARQLSSQVSGVLFVLDEPAAGLDEDAAQAVVGQLREVIARGNTVLAVEHHPVVLRAADQLVEFGPGAGEDGGRVVYQGPLDGLSGTPTARVLSGALQPTPGRRTANATLGGARIASPGVNVVFGPSGSGKSRWLGSLREDAGFELVIEAEAGSIARVQRSMVATVSGVWNVLRDLLAQTREAKVRGFTASTFSLNTRGGRCEACQGLGEVRVVLDPLPDVWETCSTCLGARFEPDVLEPRWKGHNALELLELPVDRAFQLLSGIPKLERSLRALREVGLGHLSLGRATTTLSGGEMRRLKLGKELARLRGEALVLADEPSLGLHPSDTSSLMKVFESLAAGGATVVLASSDPWVAGSADVVFPPEQW